MVNKINAIVEWFNKDDVLKIDKFFAIVAILTLLLVVSVLVAVLFTSLIHNPADTFLFVTLFLIIVSLGRLLYLWLEGDL